MLANSIALPSVRLGAALDAAAIALIEESAGLWLDPNALELADAASVTSVPDLSGNSRTATNSGTAPTFDAVGPYDKGWIDSPGRILLTPSFDHWPSKRGTWFVVYRPTSTVASNAIFFGSFSGGTSPVWVFYNNNETQNRYLFANSFGTSPNRLQGDLGGEVVVRGVRRTSDTAWEWWRGASKQWEPTLADVALASNPLRIGQSFQGKLGEILFFPSALTDAQMHIITDYLNRKWAGGTGINMVFEGDSQTAGVNEISPTEDDQTYPYKLVSSLGSDRITYRNNAVGGSRWVEMEGRASTVDSCLAEKALNVLLVWCGTNEAYLNDAATSAADAASYLSDRKAAGWDKIVVLPALDRTDQSNEVWRAAYNSALETECTAEGYIFADIAADSRIGDAGDYADTDYFQADEIHTNDGGNAVVAGIVETALTGQLGL